MSRIGEALASLGYEQSPHIRHKAELLRSIRHFASAGDDAELMSQATDEIERLISSSMLPPGMLKAGSIDPAWMHTARWRKSGRFHIMNEYGYARCGQTSLIEHEAIEARLVPAANQCQRVGCRENWPVEGLATEPTGGVQQLLRELYQVLGELGAPESVLDQVAAAMEGHKLPFDTLLPFAK
ncbi:hypothetical protein [Metapseudomonas otitidis]|uniref:hypothetical protein n=1 Tax=Metapseudomonas otitidis TaxID=319939 RepID=UPI000D1A6E51|nr:hypothetical protein [Pseudomonas otitidis]